MPVAGLYVLVVMLRRSAYRAGLLKVERLRVPVVVVGNIAVGGSGKTPVVAWLADALRARGWKPGIVSRGYGRRRVDVALVTRVDDPAEVGDEPVLLAQLTACPVAVCADRPAAVRALLQAFQECDVVISDDGLQHYRLHRDAEIVVVDEQVIGNGLPLPAGPMREARARLAEATLVVAHGGLSSASARAASAVPVADMVLAGTTLEPAGAPRADMQPKPVRALAGARVHGVAGIGRPERFFAQLEALGFEVVAHPFPDHHAFCRADLDFGDDAPIIMTAKDAVKCVSFDLPDAWQLPVRAVIPTRAVDVIVEKIAHGREVA